MSDEPAVKPERAKPGHRKNLKRTGVKSAVKRRARTGASTTAKRGGAPGTGRRGKYNASGRYINDRYFASEAEGVRYLQLKALAEEGVIDRLECQPRFPVTVNNDLICAYVADFRYDVIDDRGQVLRTVIEDVKGMMTDIYKLKRKLVQASYGIEIQEIPSRKVSEWAGRTG